MFGSKPTSRPISTHRIIPYKRSTAMQCIVISDTEHAPCFEPFFANSQLSATRSSRRRWRTSSYHQMILVIHPSWPLVCLSSHTQVCLFAVRNMPCLDRECLASYNGVSYDYDWHTSFTSSDQNPTRKYMANAANSCRSSGKDGRRLSTSLKRSDGRVARCRWRSKRPWHW